MTSQFSWLKQGAWLACTKRANLVQTKSLGETKNYYLLFYVKRYSACNVLAVHVYFLSVHQ